MTHRYPEGTVRDLLKTRHVSVATREAIEARLAEPAVIEPAFFAAAEFTTLRAVCARLIPQPDRTEPIDIAGRIDTRLAAGTGDGWRYDALPPDATMYRSMLRGLDGLARERGVDGFARLDEAGRDEILATVQRGEVQGGIWDALPAARCFEELLAEVAEIYYAHPLAQEEIGYVGMADVPAWTTVGLDAREDREPRPARSE